MEGKVQQAVHNRKKRRHVKERSQAFKPGPRVTMTYYDADRNQATCPCNPPSPPISVTKASVTFRNRISISKIGVDVKTSTDPYSLHSSFPANVDRKLILHHNAESSLNVCDLK